MDEISGNKDFETFLKERSLFSYLEFVWACKGMRAIINEDNHTSKQIVSSIYASFITSGSLSRVLSSGTLLKIVERMMHIMYNDHNLSSHSQSWDISSSSSHSSHPVVSTSTTEEYKTIFNSAEVEVSLELEKLYVEYQKDFSESCFEQLKSEQKSMKCESLKLQKYKCSVNTEEFAKELSNKLESLELEDNCEDKAKRARIDFPNGRKCDECTQEGQYVSCEEFSTRLAKAIEDKLMSMRQLEDSNFDKDDECKVLDLGSKGDSHKNESSSRIWWMKRRKRLKPGLMTIRDCLRQETESDEYSELIASD